MCLSLSPKCQYKTISGQNLHHWPTDMIVKQCVLLSVCASFNKKSFFIISINFSVEILQQPNNYFDIWGFQNIQSNLNINQKGIWKSVLSSNYTIIGDVWNTESDTLWRTPFHAHTTGWITINMVSPESPWTKVCRICFFGSFKLPPILKIEVEVEAFAK